MKKDSYENLPNRINEIARKENDELTEQDKMNIELWQKPVYLAQHTIKELTELNSSADDINKHLAQLKFLLRTLVIIVILMLLVILFK